jgi:CheY-like chemotaxis protein
MSGFLQIFMNEKKVQVYHYDNPIGTIIERNLNELGTYSAQFSQVTRLTSPVAVSDDVIEKKPDLVFLSLNFERGNMYQEGLVALVAIRQKSQVPVVMVSGSSQYEEEALEKGANTYLQTPFYRNPLLELADRLTSQPQS